MGLTSFYYILIFMITGIIHADGNWNQIQLPNTYIYPCKYPLCGNFGTNIYSTRFPTEPKEWFKEPDCPGKYRMTSNRWVSDRHSNVKGISFKGLIYKDTLGKRENEFAFFFHEERCYDGGGEYGWVFPENSHEGFFYLCGDCNKQNQKWCQWPGNPNEGACKAIGGDCRRVEEALRNPAIYRYWNIKVQKDGNFLIQLLNPVTWEHISCTIQKPDWLANMYKRAGYVTINAQKGAETTAHPPPYMHIDDVKIRQ
jgi:hypothetical protein